MVLLNVMPYIRIAFNIEKNNVVLEPGFKKLGVVYNLFPYLLLFIYLYIFLVYP